MFFVIVTATIAMLSLYIWAALLFTLVDLTASDAAGRGLAQVFAALEIVLVWLLLAVLLLLAGRRGLPRGSGAAAVVLLPLSAVAAFFALGLLATPHIAPYRWPIVTPALVPPIIAACCFWALVPPLRTAVPGPLVARATWGAVLALSLAIIPMHLIHDW